MLLSAQKQSHGLIELDYAPNHNTDVENLMTASNLVKCSWKVLFWESKNVDHCSPNIKGSTLEPRSCISTCVDVSLISIRKLEN
jgi:hypothetical protein